MKRFQPREQDGPVVRVVECGMAFGNFKGYPFDYSIERGTLTFVDSQGKWLRDQSNPLFGELQKYLTDYFNHEDIHEFNHNVERNNNK